MDANALQGQTKARWPLAGSYGLLYELIRRDIVGRYRGSTLGVLWSLITPLLMLALYTFVFGVVLKARWPVSVSASSATTEQSASEFALILFVGLIIFQIFGEVLNRAPGLVLYNGNYVKKIVFPLEILAPMGLGTAMFHALLSLGVLLIALVLIRGSIPPTALLLPLILAPYCLLVVGLAWFLASLGVYYRDIGQFLGTVINALMFLSPIFFPRSALPEWIRPWVALNPISWPVEEARAILIWGELPDLVGYIVYTVVAVTIATLGYIWFQKTRKGFADVL
jgi:lipopolysaccharide transport system permease protein